MIEISPHQQALFEKWSAYMRRRNLRSDFDWYAASHAPKFTKSIDAALSLGPEGAAWHIIYDDPEDVPGMYAAWVAPNPCGASYKTPALALCIAALRARQGGEG